MNLKQGDKVTINNTVLHKAYGIKPTDEFEVDYYTNGAVFLTNGWSISDVHVTPVDAIDLEGKVDAVLDEFIEDDNAFTAYDVTLTLRDKFPKKNIRHGEVKEIVHKAMLEYSGYERKLIDVNKPGDWPWVYYPEGYDPNSYTVGKGPQILSESSSLDFTTNDIKPKAQSGVRKFISIFGV
jgi:hypothetical protein